jgi:hypothetical protein
MIGLFLQERSADPPQNPLLAQELLADTFQPPLYQLPRLNVSDISIQTTKYS